MGLVWGKQQDGTAETFQRLCVTTLRKAGESEKLLL